MATVLTGGLVERREAGQKGWEDSKQPWKFLAGDELVTSGYYI